MNFSLSKRTLGVFFATLLVSGCVSFGLSHLDVMYGPEKASEREISSVPANHVDYWADVKPILDNRCVSCHGCYDASCQVKLTSPEGVIRGAKKQKVYAPTRIRAAKPGRLFEDAHSTAAWRKKGFHPVLNERENALEANIESSTMYRLLALKERHPLPDQALLADDFTLSIARSETCPTSGEMSLYEQEHPLWGMPYALPGLAAGEQATLKSWIEQGATYTPRDPLDIRFNDRINRWEQMINADSKLAQLSSRYIYEHLFVAHLYFSDISNTQFFKIVRSATPPGEPVRIISTRRPYDSPGVSRVFYRLIPERETIVAKSHMPYALNAKRMERWKTLFYENPAKVTRLPGYRRKLASNPFRVFRELPMQSRYKFMLDDSHISIMNYIKGSVCRGQVALNVIRDRFWVFFVDPDIEQSAAISEALNFNLESLDLPAADGNIYVPLAPWLKYAKKQRQAIKNRNRFLREQFGEKNPVTLDLIWDGDGINDNAALTIFRNFNSATVEKGLLGAPPKTAWLISYPLLERIHYLLVAGYDVYGNYGHQLVTRLYMDFLRIDGEISFLGLLPGATREKEWVNWYRDGSPEMMQMVIDASLNMQIEPEMAYSTDDPKAELFSLLAKRLEDVNAKQRALESVADKSLLPALRKLALFNGRETNFLPEVSFLRITDAGSDQHTDVTVLRNTAHHGITSLFEESKTLAPEENTVTVLSGIVTAYPNAFFQTSKADLDDFVELVLSLSSDADYDDLKTRFGIRRTDSRFWEHSDKLHSALKEQSQTEFGILDYSRLENK